MWKGGFMPYLVTSAEMKKADWNTIHYFGMPQSVLMERAALETLHEIKRRFGAEAVSSKQFMIVAGNGNNGGDGAALARLLLLEGCAVTLWLSGDSGKYSEGLCRQLEIFVRYQGSVCCYAGTELSAFQSSLEQAGFLVDALFGTGLSRSIEEPFSGLIRRMNEAAGYRIAMDIPSGISSDTGQILGTAFQADLTVTYGFPKRGCLLYPGRQRCGELRISDIGISARAFRDSAPSGYTFLEPSDLSGILPERPAWGHKGTFGKVLMLTGSCNMPGAAILSAKGAFRSGAGMVKILTAKGVRTSAASILPEAMTDEYDSPDRLEELFIKDEEWADCIVAGPGIGTGEAAVSLVRLALQKSALPLLLDADALNILSQNEDLYEAMITGASGGRIIVCTPHMGELARLLHLSPEILQKDRMTQIEQFCVRTGTILVSKDAASVVCYAADHHTGCFYINRTGNSGMATAGSGDVLAGLLGALLARLSAENDKNVALFGKTMSAGVYYHGLAGDYAANDLGGISVMAGDLIHYLPKAFAAK